MPLALEDGYSLGVDPQINYQDPGPIATGQAPQGSPLAGPLGMSNTESFAMPGGAPTSSAQRLRDVIGMPTPQAQLVPSPFDKILGWHSRYQGARQAKLNAVQQGLLEERRAMIAEAKMFADLDAKQYDMSMKQITTMAQYSNDNPMASPEQRRRFGQQINAQGARAGLPDLSPLMGTMAESPEVATHIGDALPYAQRDQEAFGQAVAALGTMSKHGATPEQKQTAIDNFVAGDVWSDAMRSIREIKRSGEQSGKAKEPLEILFDLKNRGPEGAIMFRAVMGGGKGALALTPEKKAWLEVAGLTDVESLSKAHAAKLQTEATERAKGPRLETPVSQKLSSAGYDVLTMDPRNPDHAKAIKLAEDAVKAEAVTQAGKLTGAQHQAAADVEFSPGVTAAKVNLTRRQAQAQSDVAVDAEFRKPLGNAAATWTNIYGERASGADSIRSATQKGFSPDLKNKDVSPAASAKMMQVALDQLDALTPRLAKKGLLAASASGVDKLRTTIERTFIKPGDEDLAAFLMHAGTMVTAMRNLGDIGARAKSAYESAINIITGAQSAAGVKEGLSQLRTLLVYTAPASFARTATAYDAKGTAYPVTFEPGETVDNLPAELSLIKPPETSAKTQRLLGGAGRRR